MVRSFCKCLRLHLRRLMFSKKTVLLLVLLGFFSSYICITCSSAFLGTVIASFRVLFGRSAAFTAGAALSGPSIFVNAIGKLIIGGWMQYISPLTWANINYIDWFSSGTYPGPAYVFSFWGIGTAALIALSFWKTARGDLGKDEASL